MKPHNTFAYAGLAILVSCHLDVFEVNASNIVKVPILLEGHQSDDGDVDEAVMSWDHGSTPDPLQIRWKTSQVPVRGAALEPLMTAFDYAMAYQSMTKHPTGILSLSIRLSAPLGEEGPSAGAGLAVGFLAVLRGDQLAQDIVITGTLEPSGRIGQVRDIKQKILIAAQQGYRVVLIPRGQISIPRTKLVGIESSVMIREVGTIAEAYAIVTGKQL